MSDNTENQVQESEDLFTTQDLLQESITTEETRDKVQDVEMSEDLDVEQDEDEPIEDNEDAAEDAEEITDDVETMGDDLETVQEESENVETEPDTTEAGDKAKTTGAKTISQPRISELPLSKVKHIIKLDPEVKLVNSEAVFLVTRATEAFIRTLAKESFNYAVQQKKKTITKPHVEQALTMLPVEF